MSFTVNPYTTEVPFLKVSAELGSLDLDSSFLHVVSHLLPYVHIHPKAEDNLMHYPYKWSSAPLETASHCLGTQASWPVSFRDSFVSTSLGLGYLHAWHFKKKKMGFGN